MDDIDLYNAMGSCLGINNQEVSRQIQEYETNYLTPEMDSENFKALLYLICSDQEDKKELHILPVSALSNYDEGPSKLTELPPSKEVVENIVPFLVVNKWFKVFYLEGKSYRKKNIEKEYLIVDPQLEKSQVEESLRYQHELVYGSFYLDGKTAPTNKSSYKIIRLEEIIV